MNTQYNLITHAKLLKAGLGNNLFVWAKSAIFSHINELPLYISPWTRINWGAMLRRENKYRFYYGYFNKPSLQDTLSLKIKYLMYDKKVLQDHQEKIDTNQFSKDTILIFNEMTHWSDHFGGIREHRDFIIQAFENMLSDAIKNRIAEREKPFIGVHIRMGDFAKYNPAVPFASVGGVRTPLDYFKDLIFQIRDFYQKDVPVTIFSDGSPEELDELLQLPNVKLSVGEPDVVDMMLLSKSKIIIAAAGSTFSAWAGFFANTPMIKHYDHLHKPYRDDKTNQLFYEGGAKENWKEWDTLLIDNLKSFAHLT